MLEKINFGSIITAKPKERIAGMIIGVTQTTFMGVDLFLVENQGWKFTLAGKEHLYPDLQSAREAILEIKQVKIPTDK